MLSVKKRGAPQSMLHSICLKTKMNYQSKQALLSEEAVLESCPPLNAFIMKYEKHCVVSGSTLKQT